MARMRTLTVPAPAKLNLFLHVTGRRADGYHTLEIAVRRARLRRHDRRSPVATTARSAAPASCAGVPPQRRSRGSRGGRRCSGRRVARSAPTSRSSSASRWAAGSAAAAPTPRRCCSRSIVSGSSDCRARTLMRHRRRARRRRSVLPLRRAGHRARRRRAPDAGVVADVLGGRHRAAGRGVDRVDFRGAGIDTRRARRRKWMSFPRVMGGMTCSRLRLRDFRTSPRRLRRSRERSPGARMTGSGGCVFAPFASEAEARAAVDARPHGNAGLCRTNARATSARGVRMTLGTGSTQVRDAPRSGRAGFSAGESPSWLRHRILIPAFEGSNPSSPATHRERRDGARPRVCPACRGVR